MSCQDLDDATLHLVIQMQLQDLEDLKATTKGKHKEGEPPDSSMAVDAYESELRRQAQLTSDRIMCKSIATANRLDGRIIGALIGQENQARRDREAALRLNRQEGGAPPGAGPSTSLFADSDDDDDDDPPPYSFDGARTNVVDNDLLRKLNRLYVSEAAEDDIPEQPESSDWASSRQRHAFDVRKSDCNSCLTRHPSSTVAECPCEHKYCTECLQSLFSAALTDESLFPPRCCGQPIPIDTTRPFLTPKLVGEFRAKSLELSDPNRTYCHRPACSTFVPKAFVENDIATCPKCRHKTCITCKSASHKGEDCGQDLATQSLLHVAAENGWQRCFACRRVVELEHGCNHMSKLLLSLFLSASLSISIPLRLCSYSSLSLFVSIPVCLCPFLSLTLSISLPLDLYHSLSLSLAISVPLCPYPTWSIIYLDTDLEPCKACRCGTEFCYVCGLKWKTCTCAQWDEGRLLARANVIVDRNARTRRFDAGRRARMVEREAQNLVEQHECNHRTWGLRRGVFPCEECHQTMPDYILECNQCHIHACHRCRYHRLA